MEEQILMAAEKLFVDRGFNMTSVADIAREAQCNTALVHYYFRTKKNLFQTIFVEKMRLLIENLTNIPFKAELTFEDKLRSMITTHFDFICQNPRLPYMILSEIDRDPSIILPIKDKVEGLASYALGVLQKELDAEADAGKIRRIKAFDLFLSIASLNVVTFMIAPLVEAFEKPDIADFVEQRRWEITRIIINSLKNE